MLTQVCEDARPANDEELPSSYIEEYRYALVLFLLKLLCCFRKKKVVFLFSQLAAGETYI